MAVKNITCVSKCFFKQQYDACVGADMELAITIVWMPLNHVLEISRYDASSYIYDNVLIELF
jgi:hypothetical protein